MRQEERESIPGGDGEFPPVFLCATCGRGSCPGCESELEAPRELTIAFERSLSPSALWETALVCSVDSESFFGKNLVGSGLLRPLVFAILCETFALGSIVLTLASALVLSLPGGGVLFAQPSAVSLVLFLWLAAVSLLLAVHVIAGLALYPVLDRKPPGSFRWALRFGLYSAGWDLLTSPAGLILLGFFGRSPERYRPIVAAARAPRLALRGFLLGAISVPEGELERATSRVVRATIFSFGAMFVAVLAAAVLWVLRGEGLEVMMRL